MIHHIKRATRHLIFWSLVATAIGLTALRLLLSGIDSYKTDLANTIAELIGAPVEIGRLGAKMRGFSPELIVKDIDISSVPANRKPAIQFKEIRFGLNLLDMVINREVMPSTWVTVVGANFSVKRKKDGGFAIVGLKEREGQPLWLLQGGKYEVLQSQISWQDEKNGAQAALVEKVDLAIINQADRHRINVRMKLPKQQGDRLRVSMDFTGNAFEPSAINGRVYIEGKSLELANLVRGNLPSAMSLSSGSGDFKIWTDLRHSQAVAMQGEARFQQLKLLRRDKGEFPVKSLKTGFHWRLDEAKEQWRLDVRHFLLETDDAIHGNGNNKKWPDAVFSVAGSLVNEPLLPKIGVFVEQLDLHEISGLAQFFAPLPDEALQWLAQAQATGTLKKLALFTDLEKKTFAVNGTFSNLSVDPFAGIPGMDHVSGQISGNEQAGTLRLAIKDGRFDAPNLFREALVISKLEGSVEWQQTAEQWILSSQMLALDSLELKSKNRLLLKLPKTGGPIFMDLQNSFVIEDVAKAKHYLPTGIMDPHVVDWLDNAFIGGHVPKGGLLVQGNLTDFPFTGGSGVFEVLFDVAQLELAYHPDWPHLSEVNAEVLFLQNGLSCTLHEGQSDKVKINQAEAAIPTLNKNQQVLVKGEVEGKIAQAFDFLQQTPINSLTGPLIDTVVPQGNTKVAIDLTIPLVKGLPTKVAGSADLNNAELNVKALDLPISRINGALKFNEQGVYSDTITAKALGHPIEVSVKNSVNHTAVNVSGRVGVDDLQAQFKMPGWELAKGAADYQLQLRLPYGDSFGVSHSRRLSDFAEVQVRSNLSGVNLNLPGSLAKTGDQQKALSVIFHLNDNFSDKRLLPIAINYDNKLKAALQLNTVRQSIDSGHILVGSGEAAQPREAGLILDINQDQLPLQDWLGFPATANMAIGSGAAIRKIKVHSEHALWKKAPLGAFDLALQPDKGHWSGTIESSFAKGKIHIPIDFYQAGRIDLTMDLLDFSVLKQLKFQSDTRETPLSPESMPLLNITSQKTLWQSVDLGQLTLETERIPHGMAFKRMTLTGTDQNLVLSGDWEVIGKRSETYVQGRLEMPNAAEFFGKLNITKELVDSSGIVDFSTNWEAAPYQFSLKALKGEVDVNFKDGRILSIEPGFGRILGILALEQWIKRLQLDFRDVYQEGLTFNSIKGRFDLLNGKAVIHHLVVDAVPAKITITGATDFVNRTVDQLVNVAPKSADAVPIAGTIMGKVTTLIARTLTGKDQDGFFFGSEYQVKGKWDNIQIIPLHENGGLFQKTWAGISDFPWVRESGKE